MTMGDLLKTTSAEERLKLSKTDNCAQCGVVLQETITGCRKMDDSYVCSDCYYEKFGEFLEAHPIGIPRMHRGA